MAEDEDRSALVTVRDLMRWGASAFTRAGLVFGHGSDNALDEAFHLVLWSLKLPFDLPTIYLEATLTPLERAEVLALLDRRVGERLPAAYLTGEAWFAGLPFTVDARVLIPRSPIAELIERGFEPWLTQEPVRLLDLCAGCGCIGIACALAFPHTQVDLAELDDGARQVCAQNIERHHLSEQVKVISSDLFVALGDRRYDLIVSNPPYVPTAEWAQLAPEYRHEPRLALESGADGMAVVARILEQAPDYLTPDGLLVCEIGGSQDEFEARFPRFPAIWPEFERGGDGVFIVTREELVSWQASTVSYTGRK